MQAPNAALLIVLGGILLAVAIYGKLGCVTGMFTCIFGGSGTANAQPLSPSLTVQAPISADTINRVTQLGGGL